MQGQPQAPPADLPPMTRPRLEVRPLRAEEAGRVAAYFHGAGAADLARMGVDPRKLPEAQAWERRLAETVRAGPASGSFYQAWLVDGELVGHAAVKDLVHGAHAAIHLHMWSAPHRGRGLGAGLFCRSVVDAHERLALRALVCEPSAGNPPPNRMLAKVGFPLVRTYRGSSSDLSAVTTLNRYDARRDVAEAWLRRHEHNAFDAAGDMGAR